MNKRKVYISPQKASEIIPLLGEALLLYDKVYLDIGIGETFNVIGANIDMESMEYLLSENILEFVYYDTAPIIASPDNKNFNKVMIMDLNKSGIQIVNKSILNKSLKSIYNNSIINKIQDLTNPIDIETDILLENIYSDMNNQKYMEDVFSYVVNYFKLPELNIQAYDNGCIIKSNSKNNELSEEQISNATYALHLISEVNYRTALASKYNEIICESELESFFIRKMQITFQNHLYDEKSSNFLKLSEIHEFPDVKELISSGLFNISDILDLRRGNGKFLRIWINDITENNKVNNDEFAKEYAKILANEKHILSVPQRKIVFGILQAFSLVKPIESMAVSYVNEFILPKILKGWQPRWFFDKARNLKIEKEQKVV